jgi:two-component system, NarL family, sensor histidine kinase DesK
MMNFFNTSSAETGFPRVARLLVPLLGLFFLVYPVQLTLLTHPSPRQLVLMWGGVSLFALVYLWLMLLNEPLQLVPAQPAALWKYRAAILLLIVLAGVLSFNLGVAWRMLFLYHINVAAGLMLLSRDAYIMVAIIAVLTAVLGFPIGLAWLAVPALALGLWSISFVRQVAVATELREAREELALVAVSEERLRFSRDLHDLLGHSLSLIALKSALAEKLLPKVDENAAVAKELRDLQSVARNALTQVREAVSGYRQPSLAEELVGARTLLEAAGITCQVQRDIGVLPEHVEAVLTWVVREGVTNVVRHSHATSCEIVLTQDEQFVRVEIKDNGVGSRNSTSDGSGLAGLAERLEASGGRLEAGSSSEGGFVLRACLPLDKGNATEVRKSATSSSIVRES